MVMLANEYESHSVKAQARVSRDEIAQRFIIQPKLDGVWAAIFPDCRVMSRTGKRITSLPVRYAWEIAQSHLVIVGELVVPGASFEVNSGVARRTTPQSELEFVAHDSVDVERWVAGESDETPYRERLECLRDAIPAHTVVSVSNDDTWQGLTERAKLMANQPGFDGFIAKDPEGYYHHRRSIGLELIKIKPLHSGTYPIVGVHAGLQGKGTKLGGYLMLRLPGDVTCKVGTGFGQATLAAMRDEPESFLGQMAEVAHMGQYPDGGLREPRYLGLRADA